MMPSCKVLMPNGKIEEKVYTGFNRSLGSSNGYELEIPNMDVHEVIHADYQFVATYKSFLR